MRYCLAADGIRLAYMVQGEGEPLVLLNPQAMDHRFWNGLLEAYTDRYQVITFDTRGTGASDKPELPPYSTRALAQDVISLLDALEIARAHLYGISMGGRVAQWVALDYPDRVQSLMLGATSSGNLYGTPRSSAASEQLFRLSQQRPETMMADLELFYTPEWIAEHRRLGDLERIAADRIFQKPVLPVPIRRQLFLASEEHDTHHHLHTLEIPTLVMHGTADQITPVDHAEILAASIPHARLHLLEGKRHGFVDDSFEEVITLTRTFLAEQTMHWDA